VSETAPAVAKDVVSVAVLPEIVAVPMGMEPFKNVTLPVGVFPCTVAVSITCCCSSMLVAEAVSVVDVAAGAVTDTEAKPVEGP
jgi:hypothetical protein